MTAVYKKIVDQKINMSFSMTQSGLDHSWKINNLSVCYKSN
jgi:hypothetical protein